MSDTRYVPKLTLKDIEKMDQPITEEYFDVPTDFKKLDSDTREALVRERLRTAIRRYGEEGLSIDELVKLTNHDKRTIQMHLTTLENLREIYAQKKNYRLTLYYPNGKPLHNVSKKSVQTGNNTSFDLSLAQGPRKNLFFHIVEKRFSLLEGDKTEGIIMVPLQDLDAFIEGLKELRDQIGDIFE